jgi:hypothetical protein
MELTERRRPRVVHLRTRNTPGGERKPGCWYRRRLRSAPLVGGVAGLPPRGTGHLGLRAVALEGNLAQLEWLSSLTFSYKAAKPFLHKGLHHQGTKTQRAKEPIAFSWYLCEFVV